MIFVKSIEAYGFKSFAENTNLSFEYPMTGIVGPNGSGKSNITDALRWALGEQSSKSLRGSNMEDVVFSGSVNKAPLNIAEVTVTFDNKNRIFKNLDFNEVSITRKLFKDTKESEYYINHSRVRLKDVQEIAMETGITKSSLAIISQGTISNFVEAKPNDRRKIFDDAAGISIYKKRKEESIRKIVRTQENLDRLNDILNEIERKLPGLKKQAEKAKQFQEKWNELKVIEVAILAKDISLYENRIVELEKTINILSEQIKTVQKDLDLKTMDQNNIYLKNNSIEQQMAIQNDKFSRIVEQISALKILKINLESKKQNSSIDQNEYRISELKRLYRESQIHSEHEEKQYELLMTSKNKLKEELETEFANRYKLSNALDFLKKEIYKIDLSIDMLNKRVNNNDSLHFGVKNILQNRNSLSGIIGTVDELIKVQPSYENAILPLLSTSQQNIVMKDAISTKHVIKFLKENRAGYATFLPMDNLRVNYINDEIRFAIEKSKGFIAYANQLVDFDDKYAKIADYLLGTAIVVDNYDNAIAMSKLINQRYNVLTLDGERILPNGAVVGGERKFKNPNNSIKEDIEKAESLKVLKEKQEFEIMQTLGELNDKIEHLNEKKSENTSLITISRQKLESIEKELNRISEEYRQLTGKRIDIENDKFKSVDGQIIEVSEKIIKFESECQDIKNEIELLKNSKSKYLEKQNKINTDLNQQRQELFSMKDEVSAQRSDILLISERKTNALERLAQEYNLTFETAMSMEQVEFENEQEIRDKVINLRNDIRDLGNVNIESIAEYEAENARYEEYKKQIQDIVESVNNLKKAVKEMDEKMVEQFTTVINDVNKALPETFKRLFNGGTAQVIFTETDNILETGIDIKIEPPGKKITNLNLLSGGEKSLVALTVLFSILKVRPLPLVVLDEVEAPLDIANVERFAKYIKSFTKQTQFMIVTHRMGTMENCDILFGATMEQKGITKIVQIKLIEAKKITNAN
ncbi:AAA family ATPase [Spiroplasma endosymbiont of Crioceris asparagi]|uniref:AAA family ATPase n=1 Tax=Spiroplasma endosymbiont of Crioceris asparagi TaxID=3066286 RepID=UPI0030CE260C